MKRSVISNKATFEAEDRHLEQFVIKQSISIERRGEVYIWSEEWNEYIDFTPGWEVTRLGHAHPAINQDHLYHERVIIKNPNSGRSYSPARARLLNPMVKILPPNITRVFSANNGAEANNDAINLARKHWQDRYYVDESELPRAHHRGRLSHRPGQAHGELSSPRTRFHVYSLQRYRCHEERPG